VGDPTLARHRATGSAARLGARTRQITSAWLGPRWRFAGGPIGFEVRASTPSRSDLLQDALDALGARRLTVRAALLSGAVGGA